RYLRNVDGCRNWHRHYHFEPGLRAPIAKTENLHRSPDAYTALWPRSDPGCLICHVGLYPDDLRDFNRGVRLNFRCPLRLGTLGIGTRRRVCCTDLLSYRWDVLHNLGRCGAVRCDDHRTILPDGALWLVRSRWLGWNAGTP